MEGGRSCNKSFLLSKLNISVANCVGNIDSYYKKYLPGSLLVPYAVLNISCGREETDNDLGSKKNMVEVAVVVRILEYLYKAWKEFREQLCIAVASSYTAQVVEIQEKLGEKYKSVDGFMAKAMSFDELQGKEYDIIILSTVSSNSEDSQGFISNHQTHNGSTTIARHCLWILGNERTLSESDSAWRSIISDAKDRYCFFNIEEDKDMSNFVTVAKKELDQLEQVLDPDSYLLKNARWKVQFADNFRRSFGNIKSMQIKKLVIISLLKLANGWRPKRWTVSITCDKSKHILKQFRVKHLYVIFSTDIDDQQEDWSIQVLNIWDLLPLMKIPELVEALDSLFLTYTDEFRRLCKATCLEGDLEVPMIWEFSIDFRPKKSSDVERKFPVESKVSGSFFLMKFYSISSGMVTHMLSNCNGTELDLPFDLTGQEKEIIRMDKSSFILGRSGTGKTTVIIRKLFRAEQLHHVASRGFHEIDDSSSEYRIMVDGERDEERRESILRQIFVTLNPRLCHVVKKQLEGLKRFTCAGKAANDLTLNPFDGISADFEDIPDSFVGLTPSAYPLVITFHKFLMMLDGSIGDTFFNRFPEARGPSHGSVARTRSMAQKTFMRSKEVSFDKFNISYWPHFKKELTTNLHPSTVFSEIMSHIKGGLHAWNTNSGKLSREDYILQSSSRVSNLDEQERDNIYEIFLHYEKNKIMNAEYDLADLVIDLHHRLGDEEYEFAKFDFVYIDEVQDLTMGQIALFRHVCNNVDAGFVFAGDTAQTIAKGIDFRFEDIRHLFYEEFVMKSRTNRTSGRKEKGVIAGISQLSQNFRTHAGVLKLAQSVIDVVYSYFPLSIDVLMPETSFIGGETPLLVERGHGDTEFHFMLGRARDSGRNFHGLGADQVILVREDNTRNEILKYAGNYALILTISESKGLEFQDVILYDFFASSPVKEKWKLVYTFMKDGNIPGCMSRRSCPAFDWTKHRLVCSELKQLYVAITRTRQRLWILETGDEHGFSAPMLDYWKALRLVEVRRLDDSFLVEIQVSSSKQEWKSRGMKFFNEKKYEPARMCFERAEESYWANLAKASGLQAAAWNISASNSGSALVEKHEHLREAATIFIAIEEFEAAAQCWYESKDYLLAGFLFMERFTVPKLKEAAECFMQAASYKLAADAYAKSNFFRKCIECCQKGELFDEGLCYIFNWKEHAKQYNYMKRDEVIIEDAKQKLLEDAAKKCKNLGDKFTMMKYIKLFNSSDSMRSFLKKIKCIEELIQLEIEWGNFLDAANMSKDIGDTLLESELLEKSEHYKEAALVVLFHVFSNSISIENNKVWKLKQFAGKKELLDKAQTLAERVSLPFSALAYAEKNVLSDDEISLPRWKRLFYDSKRCQSVGGEILCAWKILDFHFSVAVPKYVWQFPAQNLLSRDQVTVETLIFFWNTWKENIRWIINYLRSLESDDPYGRFCLNYLGVRLINNQENNKAICHLLNPSSFWLKYISNYNLHRKRRIVTCDVEHFAHAARSYWNAAMWNVGNQVLKILIDLSSLSKKSSLPTYCQALPLVHMHAVAKSLQVTRNFVKDDNKLDDKKLLDGCLDISSMDELLGNILDQVWNKIISLKMNELRDTKEFKNIVEDVICKTVRVHGDLSYGEIGKVVTLILWCSLRISWETYWKVRQRFHGIPFWSSFIECFEKTGFNFVDVSVVTSFHRALQLTYYADCIGMTSYMSPQCFIFLVERLATNIFYLNRCFFSERACFLEWLLNCEWNPNSMLNLKADQKEQLSHPLSFIADIIAELLLNSHDVITWMETFNLSLEAHPLLVQRLFVVLCLLFLNSGNYYDLLMDLLDVVDTASKPLQQFCNIIRDLRPANLRRNVLVLSEAFSSMGNNLVVACSRKRCSRCNIPGAILVDLQAYRGRQKLIRVLFEQY